MNIAVQDSQIDAPLTGLSLPQVLLFDVDGVLVDVRESYRQAIAQTVIHFGGQCSADDIAQLKRRGNANNDWQVTQTLLANQGLAVDFAAVQAVFEGIYQGSAKQAGVWQNERLTVPNRDLAAICRRFTSALVTGRPRRDAQRFVDHFELGGFFRTMVCMEDAPLKPSPEPANLALRDLGQRDAWMLGDTPDDMRCANAAGVLAIGIVAPGESTHDAAIALAAAGAQRIYSSFSAFLGVLDLRVKVSS